MTLYEYRCNGCRALFDVRRPMACRNEPATCPQCGAAGFRVISRPQAFKHAWSTQRSGEELRKAEELWGD